MTRGYIPVDRDQQFLLPSDMRGWLPENHLVWWLLDVVGGWTPRRCTASAAEDSKPPKPNGT